ncbi:MAG: hypothetical protein Q4Q31_04735 [Bacillota bacterium]|nr:hypothetical protein [Bacillota bacterium]
MSAQLLGTISIIFLGLGILFLLVSVYVFIKYRIKDVINDLNGKTAQREIEKIREENKGMSKSFKTDKFNSLRGKRTKKIDVNQTVEIKKENAIPNVNESTTILNTSNETTLLVDEEGTTLLNTMGTEELSTSDNEEIRSIHFEVIETQMFIQTNEFI